MRILINSIAAHVHMCSKFGKIEGLGTTMRSRELSETSLGPVGTATLQGTEENSAYNSRNSPTSNTQQRMEEEEEPEEEEEEEEEEDMLSLPCSDQKEPELETIFENARSESPDSPPPGLPKSVISAENPLFYSILPHASPHHRRDHRINSTSSRGLPPGWTMQVMDNGKILYVDNNNQMTSWTDPRTAARSGAMVPAAAANRRGPFFNSPPSPLSLMDVLTIGSGAAAASEERRPLTGSKMVEEDEEEEEEDDDDEEFYDNDKMAQDGDELMLHPPQERLLPIGAHEPLRYGAGGGRTGGAAKAAKQHQSLSLLDRVWQVLGSSAETEDCLPLVENDEGAGAGGGLKPQNGAEGSKYPSEAGKETASSPVGGGLQMKELARPAATGRQRKLGTAKEPPPLPGCAGGGKEVTDSVSEAGGGWMTADSAHSSYCDPLFKDAHSGGGGAGIFLGCWSKSICKNHVRFYLIFTYLPKFVLCITK